MNLQETPNGLTSNPRSWCHLQIIKQQKAIYQSQTAVVKVMACRHLAPSHNLDQGWLCRGVVDGNDVNINGENDENDEKDDEDDDDDDNDDEDDDEAAVIGCIGALVHAVVDSETAAVAEAAPIAVAATNSDAVTHFRPVRICPSRNWEGRYADDCSSDELQESSQESLSVVDKTEDSD